MMELKDYLNKTVEYTGASSIAVKERLVKVIAYDESGLIIYDENLDGNDAAHYKNSLTNWSMEHTIRPEENYWWVPKSSVKIKNSFKDVFNDLKHN